MTTPYYIDNSFLPVYRSKAITPKVIADVEIGSLTPVSVLNPSFEQSNVLKLGLLSQEDAVTHGDLARAVAGMLTVEEHRLDMLAARRQEIERADAQCLCLRRLANAITTVSSGYCVVCMHIPPTTPGYRCQNRRCDTYICAECLPASAYARIAISEDKQHVGFRCPVSSGPTAHNFADVQRSRGPSLSTHDFDQAELDAVIGLPEHAPTASPIDDAAAERAAALATRRSAQAGAAERRIRDI